MAEKIGVYLRLSDEDGNSLESNSIKVQRELIYDYIIKDNELSSYEILEFCDDGYSGTNFNRPGIKELLLKGKNGEVVCIIVKDFSRFGRNYIEVGRYLEQIFPAWGLRFIAINDGFDSKKAAFYEDFMTTAFKNLVCDLYSKDLSQKITSVKRSKAEQGQFITAFAPYGYQKTKERKLVVDKEVAPVVERIFTMALEGVPKVEIARTLNREKEPSPYMLRKMRKDSFSCNSAGEKHLWRPSVISKILKDQRYVGDGIFGKVEPLKVGSKQSKIVTKTDWVIIPNTHEGIIKREVFEKVNADLKRYKQRNKEENPLSKKVRCGACNHIISRKKSKEIATYRCASLEVSKEFGCYGKRIKELQIEEAVLFYLKGILQSIYLDYLKDFYVEELNRNIEKTKILIKEKEKELRRRNLTTVKLYEAFKDNKVDKSDYLKKKAEYKNQYNLIQNELLLEQEMFDILYSELESESDVQSSLFQSLTIEMVETFVDIIIIKPSGELKICWNFQDLFYQ
ncbi:recombinase family protein [Anaerotignum sp. MB30-C6]|uniref:recombinase family protein n=1 Tax=Anaerotignum sp. MB30-C6 TaxID=3070814 RepID=UPI0027DAE657|nr:recombinase family protein [Anaerotignum sp. MB30-C6]WMI82312.1 recombinase family protein [Anaerotignum sp. MB30-C6]